MPVGTPEMMGKRAMKMMAMKMMAMKLRTMKLKTMMKMALEGTAPGRGPLFEWDGEGEVVNATVTG